MGYSQREDSFPVCVLLAAGPRLVLVEHAGETARPRSSLHLDRRSRESYSFSRPQPGFSPQPILATQERCAAESWACWPGERSRRCVEADGGLRGGRQMSLAPAPPQACSG